MNPFTAILLFSIIWWLVFMVVMALPGRTQAEHGDVVPGTPSSAPANIRLWRRVFITTLAAAVIFAIVAAIIVTGVITIRDLDMFNRLGPPPGAGTGG